MARNIILLAALILQLGGVFSFYIAKEDQQRDVYEIKEDLKTHTLTIKNPKPEKPTLREIIYYHIIEKPYDQVKSQNNNSTFKNTDIVYNRPLVNQNQNSSELNKVTEVESFIEIKGNTINYITGNTDIANNKYSIVTNYNNQVEKISMSEKPEASEMIQNNLGNSISETQVIDSMSIFSGITDISTSQSNKSSSIKNSNTVRNKISETSKSEKMQSKEQDSSHNVMLSGKYPESNDKQENTQVSQVNSLHNSSISIKHDVAKDTNTIKGSQIMSQHERNNVHKEKNLSVNDYTNEVKAEKTKNITTVNVTFKHNTSNKKNRENIRSYQIKLDASSQEHSKMKNSSNTLKKEFGTATADITSDTNHITIVNHANNKNMTSSIALKDIYTNTSTVSKNYDEFTNKVVENTDKKYDRNINVTNNSATLIHPIHTIGEKSDRNQTKKEKEIKTTNIKEIVSSIITNNDIEVNESNDKITTDKNKTTSIHVTNSNVSNNYKNNTIIHEKHKNETTYAATDNTHLANNNNNFFYDTITQSLDNEKSDEHQVNNIALANKVIITTKNKTANLETYRNQSYINVIETNANQESRNDKNFDINNEKNKYNINLHDPITEIIERLNKLQYENTSEKHKNDVDFTTKNETTDLTNYNGISYIKANEVNETREFIMTKDQYLSKHNVTKSDSLETKVPTSINNLTKINTTVQKETETILHNYNFSVINIQNNKMIDKYEAYETVTSNYEINTREPVSSVIGHLSESTTEYYAKITNGTFEKTPITVKHGKGGKYATSLYNTQSNSVLNKENINDEYMITNTNKTTKTHETEIEYVNKNVSRNTPTTNLVEKVNKEVTHEETESSQVDSISKENTIRTINEMHKKKEYADKTYSMHKTKHEKSSENDVKYSKIDLNNFDNTNITQKDVNGTFLNINEHFIKIENQFNYKIGDNVSKNSIDDKYVTFNKNASNNYNTIYNDAINITDHKIKDQNQVKQNIDQTNKPEIFSSSSYNTKSATSNFNNDIDYERVIYVINHYDNPYDGKEGVNYTARQFTNGHGYQYFYPHPEDQITDDNIYELNNSQISDTGIDKYLVAPGNSKANSVLGTIVVASNDELDSLEDNESKPKGTTETIDTPIRSKQMKNRTKRAIQTLMSVSEDIAPEDMYKEAKDKISERVKRNLREGDTYGMTLTGGIGVIWNDFNKEKVSFPVGGNSNDLKVISNADREQLRTTNIEEKAINQEIHVNHLENGLNKNYPTGKFNIDNNEEHDGSMLVKTTSNEWDILSSDEGNMKVNSEEKGIEKLNEINKDKNNDQKFEEKSLEEYNIAKMDEEDYYGHKSNSYNFEPLLSGKTYGMNLIGGSGNVWNDLSDRKLSFRVGESTSDQDNNDDQIINTKVAAFHSFLRGAPSVGSSQNNKPQVVPSAKITNNREIKHSLATGKENTNRSNTESPITKQPTKLRNNPKPKVVKVANHKLETKILKTENSTPAELIKLNKTYGMSLSGDEGIVWNDLNGVPVSYHVGDDSFISAQTFRRNKDDDEINTKIAQFQKSLKEGISKKDGEETKIVNPTTDKPVIIEPLTEAPNISEPNTHDPYLNRPTVIGPATEETINTERTTSDLPVVTESKDKQPDSKEDNTQISSTEESDDSIKTYGMSLTGDNGLVWNDLNGDRVSYHVGATITESKEPQIIELTTAKPSENDGDETDHLLNEIDDVLNEIDDILDDMAKETDKPKEDNYKKELNELIEIIKEMFANESAKLDEKLNILSNQKDINNYADKNNDNLNPNLSVQELLNNEEFRIWLNNWSSTNTEVLMTKVNEYIKQEVGRQLEEHLAKHYKSESSNSSLEDSSGQEINGFKENIGDEISKKHKDCDNKKDKKESDIQIAATNVYGSSVGNKNVTNIFIYNVNKMSDLNNDTLNLITNSTDGVHIFGIQEEELADNESTEKPVATNSTPEAEKVTNSDKVPGKSEESLMDETDTNTNIYLEEFNENSNQKSTEKPIENNSSLEEEKVIDSKLDNIPKQSEENLVDEISNKPSENIVPEEENIKEITNQSKESSNDLDSEDTQTISSVTTENPKETTQQTDSEENIESNDKEDTEIQQANSDELLNEIAEESTTTLQDLEEFNENPNREPTEKPIESNISLEEEKFIDSKLENISKQSEENLVDEIGNIPSENITPEQENIEEIINQSKESSNELDSEDDKDIPTISNVTTENSKETSQQTESEENK